MNKLFTDADSTTPAVIARLNYANHDSRFRSYGLRAGGKSALFSPFLGVDHYWMGAPTFPPHKHSGMSAVSYLLRDSETGMNNRDSIGTQNLIKPGGLHWTTAGRGVVHEEVPAEQGKTVHGLQIFVALAPSKQEIAPFPLMLEPEDVSVIQLPGATIRVPLGNYADKYSPLTPPTDVTLLDITLEENAEVKIPVPAGHLLFAMPISGAIEIQGQSFSLNDQKLPLFAAQHAPREIALRAPMGSVNVVLFSALPLRLN
ncbi:TPA: pirin family protein [Klebsiella pneumoniae]|uniref:pirin family protein n=1 Tax=Klebsiella pneumoniae TaxID=573 RepID=UPI0021CC8435|nr:pirin family protein [Klebsiella pneumoniae]